ncbi:MAG TPA: hypothetical protein VNF99_00610 [Stellaceae bacterium]|nr:hypothetical protein [Stellaceae bacterium]
MNLEIKGSPWEWAIMALAGLSLVLVIVNAGLVVRNQAIQGDVTQRQQIINQGLQFARIRQALAQMLVSVAVSKNDRDLSDMLTRHGIALTGAAAAPAAPAASQGK